MGNARSYANKGHRSWDKPVDKSLVSAESLVNKLESLPEMEKPPVLRRTAFEEKQNLSCFAVDRNSDFDHNVCVQCHSDSGFAHSFDRAIGHADLGFCQTVAGFVQLFSDVVVGD